MNLKSIRNCKMKKIHFFVDLKQPMTQGMVFDVDIHDDFFKEMGGYINKGDIKAKAVCEKVSGEDFLFNIHSVGSVFTPCDRCLDDVELRIDITNKLAVRLGDFDEDEGDTLVVNRRKPEIDLAYLVYQFVALSLPVSRVHQPGKCNLAMMKVLSSHQVDRGGDEAEAENPSDDNQLHDEKGHVDHRWDKLKQLLNK